MTVDIAYIRGFFVGILAVAVVSFIIGLIFKRKGILGENNFDERQELARGKAYKAAFWVLVLYLCITNLLNAVFEFNWSDNFTGAMIGICLSFSVFAVNCILNDAYLSLKEKPRNIIVLLGFVALLNFAVAMINIRQENHFISNGVLTIHAVNLIVGFMLLVILAVFIIKLRIDSKTVKPE